MITDPADLFIRKPNIPAFSIVVDQIQEFYGEEIASAFVNRELPTEQEQVLNKLQQKAYHIWCTNLGGCPSSHPLYHPKSSEKKIPLQVQINQLEELKEKLEEQVNEQKTSLNQKDQELLSAKQNLAALENRFRDSQKIRDLTIRELEQKIKALGESLQQNDSSKLAARVKELEAQIANNDSNLAAIQSHSRNVISGLKKELTEAKDKLAEKKSFDNGKILCQSSFPEDLQQIFIHDADLPKSDFHCAFHLGLLLLTGKALDRATFLKFFPLFDQYLYNCWKSDYNKLTQIRILLEKYFQECCPNFTVSWENPNDVAQNSWIDSEFESKGKMSVHVKSATIYWKNKPLKKGTVVNVES